VAGESDGVGQQRREPLHPLEHGDVINLDPTFDQQLRYRRTATTITSVGNRNPANVDVGGNHGRERVDDFTAQACLDLAANAQCNGTLCTPPATAGPGHGHGHLDATQEVQYRARNDNGRPRIRSAPTAMINLSVG
jgi:hypothetical protein